MPQLKTWNGSAWVVPKAVKTWDGSQWVDRSQRAKYWNGSAWVGAPIIPPNYVIHNGILVNGYALTVTTVESANHGYDAGANAYKLDVYLSGGHIRLRTNKNFSRVGYTKVVARMSSVWSNSGGYGEIMVTDPLPGSPTNNYGIIDHYPNDPSWTLQSTPLSTSLVTYSLAIQAYASSGGQYTLYVRDLYFE